MPTIPIKTDVELERMRESCGIAARVRDSMTDLVVPGITTLELADRAGKAIEQYGAKSAFLGYRGYPGQICVSVSEEVVHGIPGKRKIKLGDIVSLDIGVKYRGYVGDTAVTVMVGVADPQVIKLVQTTRNALEAGIANARAGSRLSDISHAIEQAAVSAGFSVVHDFVGHGIGKKMHEEPQIPNFGRPGHGPVLKEGMTLALEPMVNAGAKDVVVGEDGWTVSTRDGGYSAHFEHVIAIRNGKAEILTI